KTLSPTSSVRTSTTNTRKGPFATGGSSPPAARGLADPRAIRGLRLAEGQRVSKEGNHAPRNGSPHVRSILARSAGRLPVIRRRQGPDVQEDQAGPVIPGQQGGQLCRRGQVRRMEDGLNRKHGWYPGKGGGHISRSHPSSAPPPAVRSAAPERTIR